ncbi:Sulfur carrier protein ThiS [Corynebacterium atrinae]|uniref:sulfur carrier protein ThiS n=1 Tax=Corynebacterium atrinae TaxID=1336740 RepID=UPI0025B3A0A4|nr:sulfur carrier protein ThiS [Corynebacterium atrinae]WJY63716.1 Sulfur carrier protein ThiS [Corynebacterium atrinae]
MNITLNDEPVTTTADTLEALLVDHLGTIPAAGLAVAVDGVVVPRSRWSSHLLVDGCVVDILSAVQGG